MFSIEPQNLLLSSAGGDHSFFIALKFIVPQFLPLLVCRASPWEFKRVPSSSFRSTYKFAKALFIALFYSVFLLQSLSSLSSSSYILLFFFFFFHSGEWMLILFRLFPAFDIEFFIFATLSYPWKKKYLFSYF